MNSRISKALDPSTRARALGIKVDFEDEFSLSNEIGNAVLPPIPGIPWDLSTFDYSGKNININVLDTAAHGVFFKPDGSTMYVVGLATASIYQFALTTAWDLDTASYSLKSKSVSPQDGAPTSIFFKPDGSTMYVLGNASDRVYQYNLSIAWDVSTAVYASSFITLSTWDTVPTGINFKPDGTKMYMTGSVTGAIYQYSLSIAWALSSVTYDSVFFSVAAQDPTPHGAFFKPDGTKMYIVGITNSTLYQYTLPTPWVLTGVIYDSIILDVALQDTSPTGMFFKPEGEILYLSGSQNDSVYQYNSV